MKNHITLIPLYCCSPDYSNLEPFYKDLGVLYDLAVLLKDASIGHKPIQTLLN